MKETFATPAVGAIIRRYIDGEPHILIQTRNKANDHGTNGLLNIQRYVPSLSASTKTSVAPIPSFFLYFSVKPTESRLQKRTKPAIFTG